MKKKTRADGKIRVVVLKKTRDGKRYYKHYWTYPC